MSLINLTFQSPSDFVVIYDLNNHESSYPPSSTMFPFQFPMYAPQKLAKHQKKQASSNIHNHHKHPLARLSNMKSKMETPTTTHSFHCPLLATQ